MKIILINGQPGTGKSSIAIALKNKTLQSAHIDADSLVDVNPLGWNEDKELLLVNAFALIGNFSNAGFGTIFTAGVTRNQDLLDEFILRADKEAEIFLIWLYADKDVRLQRKEKRARDGADKPEHFDTIDKMYPDMENLEMKQGKYFKIDTSRKTIDEVVSEIEDMIG